MKRAPKTIMDQMNAEKPDDVLAEIEKRNSLVSAVHGISSEIFRLRKQHNILPDVQRCLDEARECLRAARTNIAFAPPAKRRREDGV